MQGRCAIKKHRMALCHFLQNIPNLRRLPLNHFLRAAHGMDVAEVFEPTNNERFEKNQRHFLWQTALVKFQLRADDDDRPTRVVDALAEQILAETSALALEHVA